MSTPYLSIQLNSTGSFTPPTHNETSYIDLIPPALLARSLAFAEEPTNKTVSKLWRETSFDSFIEIIDGYMQNPKLSGVVSQFLPIDRKPTADECVVIAQRTRASIINRALEVQISVPDPVQVNLSSLLELVETREDENLLSLYNCLIVSIPEDQRPLPLPETMSLAEKAAVIRNWMIVDQELLNQITELNLSVANLTALPREITLLPNLQQLNLSNNELNHLPAEIGQLVHLQRLDLSDNPLNNLPVELGQLLDLQLIS